MGDRVQLLDDGGFILLGRADRIVKVEGKRLSLTEMQRHLEAHGAIAEARIILVKGRREQLAVVATLTEAGQAQLASGDRKSTRLNSSHVAISYAVFCLKTKSKPKPRATLRHT